VKSGFRRISQAGKSGSKSFRSLKKENRIIMLKKKFRNYKLLGMLKSGLFCLFLVAPVLVFGQQYKGSPVTKDRLVNVLRLKRVPAKEILQIVNRKGVDFQITPVIEKELVAAGASPVIIAATRANFRASSEKADPDFERGSALFEAGDFEKSANVFKAVLAKQPSAENNYNVGLAYAKLERFDLSVKYFGEAAKLDPQDADIWFNYALVLNELDRFQETVEASRKYLALKPEKGEGWLILGDAYTMPIIILKRFALIKKACSSILQ